ncbi:MAG: PAS domain-containing protein [Inquilinus sp.]|nr:PAS domain-containing protein [Inquilinus sp.]
MTIGSASQLIEPVLSRLFAYWDGKRGDGKFPRRAAIDPVEIPSLLPHLFLIDVQRDPFDLVFRLAGTAVAANNGGDITGLRLLELANSAAPDLYRQAVRAVRLGRPILVCGPARNRAGAFRSVDHLMLPLATDGDRVGMLIGAAIYRPFALGERQQADAKPLRWPGLVSRESGPEKDSAA